MSRASVIALCVAAGTTLFSVSASAQDQTAGFALNRFETSERGSEWFVTDGLDFREHGRFAAGLVGDYSYKPLVVYDPVTGDERNAIVKDQFFLHLGGAVNLWDMVRVGLNLPLAVFQSGSAGQTANATFSSDNKTTIGDIRLSVDGRFIGKYEGPILFAGGLRLWVPSGSQESFTGDGAVRLGPRAMVAGRVKNFVYSGQASLNFRARNDDFAGADMGSDVGMALSAGTKVLDDRLVVGPELYWTTVVNSGDAFFGKTTTPLEVIFGGHFLAGKEVRLGAGVGPGLTRGFGTPVVRAVFSLEYVQAVKPPPEPVVEKPKDRDGDGILDDKDACPDEPGEPNDDPKKNGCPPPKDRDNDGILDDVNACPDEPGVANEDPKKNGCPLPGDRDGDTIIDPEDACPDEPGEKNDDPAKNGCPAPKDKDGDGILNPVNACPDTPGPANDDPKKNGCPVASIEGNVIVIREKIQFAYNSSKILDVSNYILEAVSKILVEHPEIGKVSVEGHTDSKGGDGYNKQLSRARAESVVKWLTAKGKVEKKRLASKGFGEEKPIDTNDTEDGRANNRRVEFLIVEQGGAK